MGRHSKLDLEMKAAIIKCIRAGLSYRRTCDFVGIHEDSFITWRQRGEKELEEEQVSIYTELFGEVKRAESEAIIMRLKNINDASKEHWQAAAWFLERKYPDEWGRKDRHEIEGELKVESFLNQLPPDIAAAIIKLSLQNSNSGSDPESST